MARAAEPPVAHFTLVFCSTGEYSKTLHFTSEENCSRDLLSITYIHLKSSTSRDMFKNRCFPDLRSRALIGASKNDELPKTGGQEDVTLKKDNLHQNNIKIMNMHFPIHNFIYQHHFFFTIHYST